MSEIDEDLRDLIERASATPWGKTCSSLWAKAATLALENGNDELAVYCHLQLCSAYVGGGESTRVIGPFMWVHRTHHEHPELFSEEALRAFAFTYDYMLRGVATVPHVSVEQIESLSTQMYQYFLQGGYPLKTYHLRRWQLLLSLGQEAEAEEEYARFLSTTPFEVVEATIRDCAVEVNYHAQRSEWELAVAIGEKGLAIDGDVEENMREHLMGEMLKPLLYLGRDSEAWALHVRSYRCHQQSPEYVEYLTEHMVYLALSGRAGRPDRLERGLSILTRHMPWWTVAESPRALMNMATSGVILLDSFPSDEDDRVLQVTLPGNDLQWAEYSTLHNPTLAEARTWMKELALKLADLFDARPGHPNPGFERTSVLKAMNPAPAPALPEEGLLKDVTGLGDYTPLSQVGDDQAVRTSGEYSGGAAVGQVRGDDDQATSADDEDDQPPYVTLQVNGAWKQMSFLELIDACARLGQYVPSIHYYQARECVCLDPQLADESFRSQLDEHLVQTWEWIVNDALSSVDYDHETSEDRTVSNDAAYMLIQESDDMLDLRRYMEAAALADEAMRTPSVEDLGVRIRGLAGLSQAATSAGYYDEAIDALREGTNLSALLGLRVEQALAAGVLADTLTKQKRFVEAAEVTQNALDISEHYPHMYALRVSLHLRGGEACAGAKFYTAAGDHYMSAAQDLMGAELYVAAALRFTEAGENFTRGRQFRRGIEAYRKSVTAYRHYRDLSRAQVEEARVQLSCATAEVGSKESRSLSEAEKAQEQFERAQQAYVRSLNECAKALAEQPGNVSDDDFALMEQLMDEVRTIVTSQEYAAMSKRSPELMDAQWHADVGKLMLESYRFALALTYFTEAASRFAACGDVLKQADQLLMLAWTQGHREDYVTARETLHRVCALEGTSSYVSRQLIPLKRRAQEMLAECESM